MAAVPGVFELTKHKYGEQVDHGIGQAGHARQQAAPWLAAAAAAGRRCCRYCCCCQDMHSLPPASSKGCNTALGARLQGQQGMCGAENAAQGRPYAEGR